MSWAEQLRKAEVRWENVKRDEVKWRLTQRTELRRVRFLGSSDRQPLFWNPITALEFLTWNFRHPACLGSTCKLILRTSWWLRLTQVADCSIYQTMSCDSKKRQALSTLPTFISGTHSGSTFYFGQLLNYQTWEHHLWIIDGLLSFLKQASHATCETHSCM